MTRQYEAVYVFDSQLEDAAITDAVRSLAAELGALVRMIDEAKISGKQGKDVLVGCIDVASNRVGNGMAATVSISSPLMNRIICAGLP